MLRVVVATISLLLLASCAGESGTGAQAPRRSASDLATIRAEAGLEDPTPTERAATPTATRPVATSTGATSQLNPGYASDANLLEALIVPSEISTTWTLGKDEGPGVPLLCGAPAIDEQFEPVGWAYGTYSSAGGEWAEQWVMRLTEPDAQSAMEHVRTAMTCDEETLSQTIGNDWYYDYNPFDLAPLGDDVLARKFNLTFQNPAFTPQVGSIVFARTGEFIVIILHHGFRAQASTAERMAAVAVARIELVRDNSV